jgi:hypothetical protein
METLIRETLAGSTAEIRYAARKKPLEFVLNDKYEGSYDVVGAHLTEDGLVVEIQWQLNNRDYQTGKRI